MNKAKKHGGGMKGSDGLLRKQKKKKKLSKGRKPSSRRKNYNFQKTRIKAYSWCTVRKGD